MKKIVECFGFTLAILLLLAPQAVYASPAEKDLQVTVTVDEIFILEVYYPGNQGPISWVQEWDKPHYCPVKKMT